MTKDEALRMALDFIERTSSYLPTSFDSDGMKIHAMLKEALAQPEQEPVAWMVTSELQDGTKNTYPLTGRFKDVKDVCDFGNPVPLYTTPPQRTWVGLTPQERDEINEQVYGAVPHHVAFHHAIEAKLKEKNNA